jgi:hypothetical protein
MKPLFLTVAAVVGSSRDSDQRTEEMRPLSAAVGVVMMPMCRGKARIANGV